MKTLGTRKKERRAAAAAAEQAQSVTIAVPANQMRKPKSKNGQIKGYLCRYICVCLQINHTNRAQLIWNRCTVQLESLPSVTKKIRMCRHRRTRKQSSNYRSARKYPLSISQHMLRNYKNCACNFQSCVINCTRYN